jgi:NADH-quinone oxidoreductase subunit N
MSVLAQSVRAVLPECLLIAAACVQFLLGPFVVTEGVAGPRRLGRIWSLFSLAALAAAAACWLWYPAPESLVDSLGMFRYDALLAFIRGVVLAAGLVLVLIHWDEVADGFAAEVHGLLLLILAGVVMAAAANDLVVLFLALELVSIPTYVFLYLPRRGGATAPEATTKYFLLSIFSSAIVLYGLSFLYGAVGTTHLGTIQTALAHQTGDKAPSILLIATACIVAGLSFRVTAVPFHFYAPDVFQGAHAGTAALLAFLPKVVGFVALLRLFPADLPAALLGSTADDLRLWSTWLFWLMSVASMFVGNVLALLQRDLKRLLAYSSIAHAGYMLTGLASGHRPSAVHGVAALLFYLVAYGATIAGVFGLMVYLRRGRRPVETIDDLAGLSQTHPACAALMTILVFSLTGLPPTAGFMGKFNLLLSAWLQGTTTAYVLAAVLAVNAAIAAAYYLRIVTVMYLRPPVESVETSGRFPAVAGVALCAAATVAIFFFPRVLWDLVDQFAV